jgi:hypothetical protein
MATISHAEFVIHSDWVYRWCFAPKGGVWQSRMVTTGSPGRGRGSADRSGSVY